MPLYIFFFQQKISFSQAINRCTKGQFPFGRDINSLLKILKGDLLWTEIFHRPWGIFQNKFFVSNFRLLKSFYNLRFFLIYRAGSGGSVRREPLQNLLGFADRVRHPRMWSPRLLHRLRQTNVRVSYMQAIRRPGSQIFQSLKNLTSQFERLKENLKNSENRQTGVWKKEEKDDKIWVVEHQFDRQWKTKADRNLLYKKKTNMRAVLSSLKNKHRYKNRLCYYISVRL